VVVAPLLLSVNPTSTLSLSKKQNKNENKTNQDLAAWLGVGPQGLFNFKPSVRPVPLEAHIQGYAGKFYCPRMAAMNKPAYAAIQV
jgi:hypothetical protein